MAHNPQPSLSQIGHFRKRSASKQQAGAFVRTKLETPNIPEVIATASMYMAVYK